MAISAFGRREVTSIDNYTPSDNAEASQYSVTFHHAVTGLPDWANSTEMKTAFPKLAGGYLRTGCSHGNSREERQWLASSGVHPTTESTGTAQ